MRINPVVRTVVVRAAFAAAFTASAILGREMRAQGSQLALVWPAAALGYLWLSWSWTSRRRVALDVTLMTLLTGVVTANTGGSVELAVLLAPGNALNSLVSCALMRRLGGDRRLRRPRDLITLAVASAAGAAASSLVGPTVLAVTQGAPLLATWVTWTLRNTVSILVIAGGAGVLVDPDRWRGWLAASRVRPSRAEAVAAAATVLGGYWLAFWAQTGLPLAFAVIPLAVWVGLRFSTIAAAAHVLLVAVIVVAATWFGHGPFGLTPLALRIPLSQTFMAIIAVLTLVLALHRDERATLRVCLMDALATAGEDAALLQAVLASTSEGVSVLGPTGRLVVRNAASHAMLGEPLVTGDDPFQAWTQHTLDGRPLPEQERPATRALAGQDVPAFETLLRHRTSGREIVVSGSLHPLPAADTEWGGGAVVVFRDVTAAHAEAAELASSRDQLAGILGAATEQAIIGFDVDGTITFFNNGAERLTGRRSAEIVGHPAGLLIDREELLARAAGLGVPVGAAVLIGVAATQRHETRQWTFVRADGARCQVQLTVTAVRDEGGAATAFMAVGTDITARVEAEANLADSEELFRLTFDLAPIGMAMVSLAPDSIGRIRRVNRHFMTFTDRSEADLLTVTGGELMHPDEHAQHTAVMAGLLAGTSDSVQSERRFLTPDGVERWGALSTAVVHPHGAREPYLVVMVEDITARKEAEDELLRQALHDALTGLPNRRLFTDRLEQALTAQGRTGSDLGLLYLDLDGFKEVNDTLGHAAGDTLLVSVADRLRACVRAQDTVARLGGDEFAVLCPDLATPADGLVVARRVLERLSRPIELDGDAPHVNVSIGLAVTHGDEDADALVHAADAAMYRAKRAGKGRIEVHEGDPVSARLVG